MPIQAAHVNLNIIDTQCFPMAISCKLHRIRLGESHCRLWTAVGRAGHQRDSNACNLQSASNARFAALLDTCLHDMLTYGGMHMHVHTQVLYRTFQAFNTSFIVSYPMPHNLFRYILYLSLQDARFLCTARSASSSSSSLFNNIAHTRAST